MSSITSLIGIIKLYLRHITSVRVLFLLSCISFGILWIEFSTRDGDDLLKEALDTVDTDRYYQVNSYSKNYFKYFKYILLWTPPDYHPFYFLGEGQEAFIKHNCSMINCYVTSDRNFFDGDVTKFDAIAFNGRHLKSSDLPRYRSPRQKYIYFNTESADNYPVCERMYDNYFNWTCTYRLDSTIVNQHIVIKDINGEVLGPRKGMEWINVTDIDIKVPYAYNKSKAAAWFASNCKSRSGREYYVKLLQKALTIFGLSVDIYGSCGTLQCPLNRSEECFNMLKMDYYFYLALENSFSEDYITEKVLTALHHYVVPIVYGAAAYIKFLPPNSYLDGRLLSPYKLAATMANLINSKEQYQRFFWWKHYYTYANTSAHRVCPLCSTLHNSSLFNTESVYKEFRQWWNPSYKKLC